MKDFEAFNERVEKMQRDFVDSCRQLAETVRDTLRSDAPTLTNSIQQAGKSLADKSLAKAKKAVVHPLNKKSILNFYNLKNLIRYNHRFRLVNESVAEHSYFTSLFAMMLCDHYGVSDSSRALAMQHALIHDIPEILISDVPFPVKEQSEKLKTELAELELKAIKELIPAHAGSFYHIEHGPALTHKRINFIVKLADILSVLQYCYTEESLGNSHMQGVKEITLDRLRAMEQKSKDLFPSYTFPYNLDEQ